MPAVASSIAPVHTEAIRAPRACSAASCAGISPRCASAQAPRAPREFQLPPGTITMSAVPDRPRSTTIRAPCDAVTVPPPSAPTSSVWMSAPYASAVRSTS
jgi:hypothetical protein